MHPQNADQTCCYLQADPRADPQGPAVLPTFRVVGQVGLQKLPFPLGAQPASALLGTGFLQQPRCEGGSPQKDGGAQGSASKTRGEACPKVD